MVSEAAVMLAQGGTPGSGGIMTPAIAFGDNLVDALHAREHCWVCLPCRRSGAPPSSIQLTML